MLRCVVRWCPEMIAQVTSSIHRMDPLPRSVVGGSDAECGSIRSDLSDAYMVNRTERIWPAMS